MSTMKRLKMGENFPIIAKKDEETEKGDKPLIECINPERVYINALPDEILSAIISLLTLRDAARASLTSKRWRGIYTSMLKLTFDWTNMFTTPLHKHSDLCHCVLCQSNMEKFLNSVDQYVKIYGGQKLRDFTINFCLGKNQACYLDRWISFVTRLHVENLMLRLSDSTTKKILTGAIPNDGDLYVFPFHLLACGEFSYLKRLKLQSTILGPNLTDQFSNLRELCLVRVILSQAQAQVIFSSCFKLEKVSLAFCHIPVDKLRVCASLQNLNYLAFCFCFGVREIELSSNSLIKFVYVGMRGKLSLFELPKMDTVHLGVKDGCDDIFNQTARTCPGIKTLSVLAGTRELDSLPRGLTAFTKINYLRLCLNVNITFATEKITAILRACPLLKKLCVDTVCVRPSHENPTRRSDNELVKETYGHLKEVEIGGFYGTSNYIDFVIYLLKLAVALKKLVINRWPKNHFASQAHYWIYGKNAKWAEGEREWVYEQLKQHVCFRDLVLIISGSA